MDVSCGLSAKRWEKVENQSHQFRETTFNTIDPKGRISIPARFRDIIRVGGDKLVVTRMDDALYAYTTAQWLDVEGRILNMTETSSKMRRFRRFFIGGAAECGCDKQGRILVPPMLRQYAGLEKNIVLIGQINHFQIWSRERYDEDVDLLSEDIVSPEVRSTIAKLGL